MTVQPAGSGGCLVTAPGLVITIPVGRTSKMW
eukprot:CAMPEP_0170194438 /NCGR_PEP_ID=MMETSP0040_2-20121228/59265_1 /TAXON_ID=641309 /ORGANISM="Lotharella oceanica, Strain CCMP622" /LENGTH=31 /DNA_ID= /DNA_START= /DNA_END= /DNA_ORIENTATION=